jgi:hypothetical protein
MGEILVEEARKAIAAPELATTFSFYSPRWIQKVVENDK